MDTDAAINALRADLRDRRWSEVEAKAMSACHAHDAAAAEAIAGIDLGPYQEQLRDRLAEALTRASAVGAAAVYWEFDTQNGWDSAFFPCKSYSSEALGNDDWAADYEQAHVVTGPPMHEFAALAAASWDRTAIDAVTNVYLVARTAVAFGRTAEHVWTLGIPLCAGYHDQATVLRIVDPT